MSDIRKIRASNVHNGKFGSPMIVLPAAILAEVDAGIGDVMSITVHDGAVVLKKVRV